MKIFIWKSYGDVDVYKADTVESLKKVFDDVVDSLNLVVASEQQQNKLDDAVEFLDKSPSIRGYIMSISDLLEEYIGTHESFEHGTGFGELKV